MSDHLTPVIAVSDGRLDLFGPDDLSWACPRGGEGTCGLQRGTSAGRKRHERAGKPYCGSCATGDAQTNRLATLDNWVFG